jgi:hypothetical protein
MINQTTQNLSAKVTYRSSLLIATADPLLQSCAIENTATNSYSN